MTLTTNQPHARYFLVWTPVDEHLEGQWVARVIAKEACLYTPPDGLHKVQSAAFQKARARECAFQQWAQEWHFTHAQNALQLRATGQPLCHETTARAARLERGFLVTLVRLVSNAQVSQEYRRDILEGFATLLQMKGQRGSLDGGSW